MAEQAVIIGAGPAGLTAAYELLERTAIRPLVLEATDLVGGISRTVNWDGNRFDLGGHRFFSRSDRVTQWWLRMLPLQGAPARDDLEGGRSARLAAGEPPGWQPGGPDPEQTDRVMLIRRRLSRILHRRRLFDYPVTLSAATLRNLGAAEVLKIGAGYLRARVRPIRPERNLEDFFINRFGRALYAAFFRDYTEKVWGVPCREIRPEWGSQRIKGLSVGKAIWHALTARRRRRGAIGQKGTETSLIERFLYPKFGPGQMWEAAADAVRERGGEVRLRSAVVGVEHDGRRVLAVRVRDGAAGQEYTVRGDRFFSTMPLRDLVRAMGAAAPADARTVAEGLVYREFLTVALLVRRMRLTANGPDLIPDNWIYIQEPDVRLGRVQIFNNWSPYMVRDPAAVLLGLEYFCSEGDDLWSRPDADVIRLATQETAAIGFIDPADVVGAVVHRMPKAYPAYFGTYDRLGEVRRFLDGLENFFPLGRNGMHRYNNMDHSMLTAMAAVDNIVAGRSDKANLWSINAEEDYHEVQSGADRSP
jgi:protoporphyrinogen oxidase